MGTLALVMWLGMQGSWWYQTCHWMKAGDAVYVKQCSHSNVVDHDYTDWVITDPPEPPIMTQHSMGGEEIIYLPAITSGGTGGVVTLTPSPLDKWSMLVPAIIVPIPPEDQTRCGPAPCDKDICLAVCTPPETTRKGCADKSRILLHAEDGTAWCLATPKEGQP